MAKYAILVGLLLMAGLASCSRQEEETGSADASVEPRHVWKDQTQTLDKARQVEQTLMDAHKRRAEIIE
ncbi:MAG: hypothetical protein U9P00_09635 [Pseudomonadota bacterium]|nr:hypothetical protein [Pseudomonadota bacterium]